MVTGCAKAFASISKIYELCAGRLASCIADLRPFDLLIVQQFWPTCSVAGRLPCLMMLLMPCLSPNTYLDMVMDIRFPSRGAKRPLRRNAQQEWNRRQVRSLQSAFCWVKNGVEAASH
jgi:hypothetical protein